MLYPISEFAPPNFGNYGGDLVAVMPNGQALPAHWGPGFREYAEANPLGAVAPTYVGVSVARYVGQPAGTVNVDEAPDRLLNGGALWATGGPYANYRGPVVAGYWGGDNITIVPQAFAARFQRIGWLPDVLGIVRSADQYGRIVVGGLEAPPNLGISAVRVDNSDGGFSSMPGLVFFRGAGYGVGAGCVPYEDAAPICKMATTVGVDPNALPRLLSVRVGPMQWLPTYEAIPIGTRVRAAGVTGGVTLEEGEGNAFIGIAMTASDPEGGEPLGSSVPFLLVSLFDYAVTEE